MLFGAQTIATFLEATHGPALVPTEPLARARAAMAEDLAFEGLVQPLARLDRAAERAPDPGSIAAWHRLNRTEYQNAIRDLLALDIDTPLNEVISAVALLILTLANRLEPAQLGSR